MSNAEQRPPDFEPDKFIDLLRRRYEENPEQFSITQEHIERCTGPLGEVIPHRFDAFALVLARGYHDGQLSFAFCDAVVNIMVGKVHSDSVAQRDTWPPLFWDVFLAFDAGEFFRAGERHIDPAEKYTRPLIAKIIDESKNDAG
ncbi:hypothetical protein P3T42_001484 [Paraburkholderia sp. GAS38]|uniref:hypothetical protein n=1 Tax=Paraburkholderia sp. GAS38 TaxID=3035133 RepID=UPI003D1D2552